MKKSLAMLRRLLAPEDGSSVVETAISCTVVFGLLIGICQTSIALYQYQYTCDAAREGSRFAMVRGSTSCVNTPSLSKCNASDDTIRSYVRSIGFPAISPTKVNVTTTWCSASTQKPGPTQPTTWSACTSGTPNAPGNLVKVVVSYPVSLVVFPFSSNSSLWVSSTSQMVIAQ